MRRDALLLVFLLVLFVVGLAIKLNHWPEPPQQSVIAWDGIFESRGFQVEDSPADAEPALRQARRADCLVKLYRLAPQGWHESLALREAGSAKVEFLYKGAVYARQPTWTTKFDRYLGLASRMFGLPDPARPVVAMIHDRACPDRDIDDLRQRLLAVLS